MIVIDNKEYRTLEEQVKWLTEQGSSRPEEFLVSAEVEGNTLTLVDQDGEEIEFTPQGGGGQTYTAGDGLALTNNEFDVVCGDGIEIDTDYKVAAKIGRGIFFDSDNAIALNNNAYNAINAVSSKLDATQLSGTNDGTNWTTLQIKGVTKNIPTGGSGGVTAFDQLSGRPKYNGADMTSSTNIPEVHNYTFNPGAGINISTSGNVKTFSVDYAANDGLKTDGNDQLTIDYDQVQAKLTAGTNITISGNTISATGGGTSYVFNPGAGININTNGNVKTFSVDYATDGGLETDGNDQLAVDFDQVQEKLVAGDNITITGNTISATGGGGTSSHLYRHDIRLEYPDGNSEIVTFSLYHASSTTLTFAQIRDMLPTNYSIPAAGNNNDGSIYNGVRKDNSDIRADTVFYDSQLECFDYGYDVIDLNWNLTDTVTTIF